MKKLERLSFLLLLLVMSMGMVLFTGCLSTGFSMTALELATNKKGVNPQILNLRNYGDEGTLYYEQSETLMKNGFLNTADEEYGYYYIHFEKNLVVEGNLWPVIAVWTLFIPQLLGAPTETCYFVITAYLDIYNSNGELVKSFERVKSFNRAAGIYYGWYGSPHNKAQKQYSLLFGAIQKDVTAESAEINRLLQEAGPITAEKDANAKNMMSRVIAPKLRYKNISYDFNGSYDSYEGTADSSGKALSSKSDRESSGTTAYIPSAQPATPAKTGSASSTATLNTGYYGMSGADTIRMQLFSGGTVSVSEYVNGNWSVNSQGSYSIAGSNVIFSFTSGKLAGQRHQYTITGNKSFSGNGETWTAYF